MSDPAPSGRPAARRPPIAATPTSHSAGGGSAGGSSPGGAPLTGIAGHRYRRWTGALAALALVGILLSALFGSTGGVRGIPPGSRVPPFAAPLATGSLGGDVNVATAPNQGAAGDRPACSVRGPQVLNVCQLYEGAPLVLALFVDGGSCARILGQLQQLAPSFPGVRFAAVAVKGETTPVRRLIRAERIGYPVGLDRDGILVTLYRIATCPQVSFVYPGGIVQSPALLGPTGEKTLRARVLGLAAAARKRGWR